MQYWTVKIGIGDSIVADGLNLTAERTHDILEKGIFGIYSNEVTVEILETPANVEALQSGELDAQD